MKQLTNPRFPFVIAAILFLLQPELLFSQKRQDIEVGAVVMASDLDGVSAGFSLNVNFWRNRYLGLTAGAIATVTKTDNMRVGPYRISERIYNLNGVTGLKLASPIYKKFGLIADARFMFAPIPFYPVNMESDDKNKTKVVFTRFNPSYSLELSIAYGAFSLGGGITSFNPYNAYYRASLGGYRLREHLQLKPDKVGAILFVRFTE